MTDKPNDTTWQAKWGKMALSKGVTVIPTAFLLHASRAGQISTRLGSRHHQGMLLAHHLPPAHTHGRAACCRASYRGGALYRQSAYTIV